CARPSDGRRAELVLCGRARQAFAAPAMGRAEGAASSWLCVPRLHGQSDCFLPCRFLGSHSCTKKTTTASKFVEAAGDPKHTPLTHAHFCTLFTPTCPAFLDFALACLRPRFRAGRG